MFLNFGRMFGFFNQSKIDNLLKQSNLTLETILDEEDILQELKSQSSVKFADFIIARPLEYEKMIAYIVDDVPDVCDDRNKQIKYPFLISEILGSDNDKLISFFFEKPEITSQEDLQNPLEDQETQSVNDEHIRANLINQLLGLLEKDVIVITQAGYFAKIICSIVRKRGYDFWEYIRHNPEILTNLMKHLSVRHICEIIEKLVLLDTNQTNQDHTEYQLDRTNLLKRVLEFMIAKKYSQVIVTNIAETFIELFRNGSQIIESNQAVKDILQVISKPLTFFNLSQDTQNSNVNQLLLAQLEYFEYLSKIEKVDFAELYLPCMELLPKLISQIDRNRIPFKGTVQNTVTPFGDSKLNLIYFIIKLLKIPALLGLFQAPIFTQIIQYVDQYPSNNQLSLALEKIVSSISDSQNEQQITILFTQTDLINWLTKSNSPAARKQKVPYSGILTRMTNYLNALRTLQPIIGNAIQECKEWDEYISSLEETNRIEQSWMLGVNPKSREAMSVENLSPPLEPLVQYNYQPPTQIRKCESSDNNEIVVQKEETEEQIETIQVIEEKEDALNQAVVVELVQEENFGSINQEDEDDNQFSPARFWKMDSSKDVEDQACQEFENDA